MTTEIDAQEKPRRNYTGSQVFPVVAALMFNLVSDIIGGVWISVIEEETARPVGEKDPDAPPGRRQSKASKVQRSSGPPSP